MYTKVKVINMIKEIETQARSALCIRQTQTADTTCMYSADVCIRQTVDLVIFACLDFREFVIWGLFTKSRILKCSISMISITFIILIFAKFAKNKTLRILPDLQSLMRIGM